MQFLKTATVAAFLFAIATHVPAAWSAPAPMASLVPEPPQISLGLGSRVALSADGSFAAVVVSNGDALSGDADVGEVYVYQHTFGWGNPTQLLDPNAQNDSTFGAAITLSADGSTLLVGAPGDDKAYLYTNTTAFGWRLTETFTDPNGGTEFGSSVALSSDGSVAVVGDYSRTLSALANAGTVYVYTHSGHSWSAAVELDEPVTQGDSFGTSIALSSDASKLVVGAPYHGNAGRAYLFADSNGSWSVAHAFDDPGSPFPDAFGTAVAISADGTTIAAGAPAAGLGGRVYLYAAKGSGWGKAKEFDEPTGALGDIFGSSLSISGDGKTWVTSAPGAAVGGQSEAGKVFLYHQVNGAWSSPLEWDDPAASAVDEFGVPALSSDASLLLVGDSNATVSGDSAAGMTYLFAPGAQMTVHTSGATDRANPQPGDAITWSAWVENDGSLAEVSNAEITDTLPAGVTYKGFTVVDATSGTCKLSGRVLHCSFPGIGPLQRAEVQIDTVVPKTVTGKLTNTASFTADQYNLIAAPTSVSVTEDVEVAGSGGSGGSGGGTSGGGGGTLDITLILVLLGTLITRKR